jgi:hypothetical protein
MQNPRISLTMFTHSIQPIIINWSNVPFSVKFSRRYPRNWLNQLCQKCNDYFCLSTILLCFVRRRQKRLERRIAHWANSQLGAASSRHTAAIPPFFSAQKVRYHTLPLPPCVADPDPGSGMGKKQDPDPGWSTRIIGISESLETNL